MLVFSTPRLFADEFRDAVEAAVWQWCFHPAEIERIEFVQAATRSYSRVLGREQVETQLDVAFIFTATGGVEMGR